MRIERTDVTVTAARAGVTNEAQSLIPVLLVSDHDGLAAVVGDGAQVTVQRGVERDDLVGLGVNGSAGTGDTVLVEPGTTVS